MPKQTLLATSRYRKKRLLILSARGDYGYYPGGRIAARNHVEPAIRTAFAYICIEDSYNIAVEYDKFADTRLEASLTQAEQDIDALIAQMTK
ncbi:MAG: hypothetical protein Q4A74_09710 [Cardiobacteriaceae bacterium]|nr:hypothetical protein [Cardiobacteriaceae bacterium]